MFAKAGDEVRRAQQIIALFITKNGAHANKQVRASAMALAHLLLASLLSTLAASAHALGIGELQVQSSIGQVLKVAIPLFGQDAEDIQQTCIRAKIYNLDGSFITNASVQLGHDKRGRTILVGTYQPISEPALSVQITLECGMRIERAWQVLLDMPVEGESINPALAKATVPSATPARPSRAERKAARDEARRQRAAQLATQVEATLAAANATPPAPAALPTTITPALDNPPSASRGDSRKSSAKAKNSSGERSVLRLSKHSDAELAELDRLVLLRSGALSPESLAKVDSREAQERVRMPEVSAEMRAAQELSSMQQKIRMLEAEATRLQLRSREQDRLLQGKPTEQYHWLIGLALVLLLALLAIAWLLWRMQQLRFANQTEWHASSAAKLDALPATQPSARPASKPVAAAAPPRQAARPSQPAVRAPAPAPAPAPTAFDDEDQDDFFAPPPPAASAPLEAIAPLDFAPLEFERRPNLRDPELEMPTVAEITDAMHEAEFWMSLAKPEKAAEVLEIYGKGDHPTSPVTWLYLFELYRSLGEEEKYSELRTQFQRRFNGQIPGWLDALPDPAEHTLENLPALLEKICMLWGTSQVIPFLEELIVDNREGMRTGFALPTYRELLFLLDLAHLIEQNSNVLEFA